MLFAVAVFLRANIGHEIERLVQHGMGEKSISKAYSRLQSRTPKPGLHKSRVRWKLDLNIASMEYLLSDLFHE